MNIRSKLVSVFIVISILLLSVVSVIYFVTAKNTLTQEVLNRLDAISSIQRNRIEAVVEHNTEKLRLVASRTQLRLSLNKYLLDPQAQHVDKINRIITDARQSIPSFKDISILDLNGNIVTSTDNTLVGSHFEDTDVFERGKLTYNAVSLTLSGPQKLSLYLSGPLYLHDSLLGVIIIETDAENIISSIQDYSGLGATGESVLAKQISNELCLYLTPLRFDQQAALNRTVLLNNDQSPVAKSVRTKNSVITDAVDYRNHAVFAASRYIRNAGWNLVVKMDKEEVYAPITRLVQFFVIVLVIALVAVILVSIIFARSLAKPIIKLTNTARAIHAGDYYSRAPVISNDEVGELAGVFNEMTESILQINSELKNTNIELQSEIGVRIKVEKDLHLQTRRNELILSTSQDGFWLIDLDGSIREVNDAYCQLLGFTREQMLSMNISDLCAKGAPDCIHHWLELIMAKGYQHFEIKQHRRDGDYLDLEIGASLAELDNEKFIFAFARDITERKQAEIELYQYRHHLEELIATRTSRLKEQAQILDQIHDSVIATNMDGIVTSWNHGAERLFGYSAKEATGKHVAFIYPKEDYAFLQKQVFAPLITNGEHQIEVRMLRKSGELFFANLSLSLLYDTNNTPKGIISYSQDITERKLSQSIVERKSEALKSAYQELESFSYSVSHDLRAPLRSIDGFSLALLDDYNELLDDTGKDYLKRIRKASQRMGELIDDMLLLSRVTRKSITIENINLSKMVKEINTNLKQNKNQHNVKIKIENNVFANGDAKLIRVVLDNLLENAWKYTSKKLSPTIEFGTMHQDGETIYFVRDNGDGFDMKYVDKLFVAFQRLHKADDFEGTGIGLATVARIINRHGGRVWAESKIHQETTIYFTLPEQNKVQISPNTTKYPVSVK